MIKWSELYKYENNVNPDFKNGLLDGRQVYAETGEEGVIREIFKEIGTETKFCVDIGAYNGYDRSNTRWLLDNGWSGLLIDKRNWDNSSGVKEETILMSNVNDIFEKYNVPMNLDFLSIDIDSYDYWILKAILDFDKYHPNLICFEFNPYFSHRKSKTIPYSDKTCPKDASIFYGASLGAFNNLGKKFGYQLIHAIQTPSEGCIKGRNAFLIKKSFLPVNLEIDIKMLHPFKWKEKYKKKHRNRKWRVTHDNKQCIKDKKKKGRIFGIGKISEFLDV